MVLSFLLHFCFCSTFIRRATTPLAMKSGTILVVGMTVLTLNPQNHGHMGGKILRDLSELSWLTTVRVDVQELLVFPVLLRHTTARLLEIP